MLRRWRRDATVYVSSVFLLGISAVAEKLTETYLEARAARGDKAKFEAVLDKMPDRELIEGDEL